MEIAIPLIALGSLYIVTNQKKKESFANNTKNLPNVNIPNKNYPSEYPIHSSETDQTSNLSRDNYYDGGAYTDKFFNPNSGSSLLGNPNKPDTTKNINGTTTDSKYTSMTGQNVDSTYFQHNNMVPFFGGNLRTRHLDNNSNESILDNYNGTGSQIVHKKEQAPMFSPHTNLQWANGMPSYSDFEQSRMNVSNKMSNVKPFGEQKVAPGLGLGAGTEGLGGYNSGMLARESWTERTVDELRVDNKPKASGLVSLGREGPAISYITKQGSIGKQEKNRPDTAFDMGPERYLTTTGVEKGQLLVPIPVEKYVSRPETTASYEGGAGYINSAEYVPGQFMPSHNQQLGSENMGPATAQGESVANVNDYAFLSNRAYANNRSVNQQNGYFGTAGKGIIAETIAPLLDILRPSRKENSIGTLRPYQNAKPAVSESYIFNPNDKPLPTIKETTVNSKFHLNIDKNQRGGGYDVAPQQVIHNARDSTTDFAYIGNSSAQERGRQPTSYESSYNQRNNEIKSSVVDSTYNPKGYMKIFDGNQNVRQSLVTEKQLNISNRHLTPQLSQGQSPNYQSLGQMNSKVNPYDGISLDRNNGDVLSQLQGNPFALSIHGALGAGGKVN
jgi:hypothetical protein